jgi:hypothetical protein
VDEGGASVIAELGTLKSWEVCLCSRADAFFAKPVVALDQGQPILRVLKAGRFLTHKWVQICVTGRAGNSSGEIGVLYKKPFYDAGTDT